MAKALIVVTNFLAQSFPATSFVGVNRGGSSEPDM
jgi:hypothetical protein